MSFDAESRNNQNQINLYTETEHIDTLKCLQ